MVYNLSNKITHLLIQKKGEKHYLFKYKLKKTDNILMKTEILPACTLFFIISPAHDNSSLFYQMALFSTESLIIPH
ncbi:hypothetical protein AOB46_19980 [Chryseobacterium indologenes]|uniref:Uncharacterized protein n=1 Tax=Chryseobacterium indologenes TaxID=253 RepID=A0A0N0ZUM5_CHRID|nr:hypothetical protein AOB46_19980 [Chryseobacterium indologenes]